MKVFISNRLENLAAMLADQLKKPLSGTLNPETIVVQSAGMAKWISLQLAMRHGVAANYRFPYPNAFMEEMFQAFIPEYAKTSFFDKGVLTWRIMELLPQLKNHDPFGAIRQYMGDGNDQKRVYQLAAKIAQAFDQYLIFRPDMILKWEQGDVAGSDESWQAILWRRILETQGTLHKAALRQKLMKMMNEDPRRPEALPERLSVFGISYLPPYHLDLLAGISSVLPVHYYYMNPSREFWADIKSEPEIRRVIRKISQSKPDLNDQSMHLETGNSLLASWGAQGRDFFKTMEEMPAEYLEVFEDGQRESLLSKVQDDIDRLREPNCENGEKECIDKTDQTIQIHACHSPIREVEALHDTLLGLFERDTSITPEDVLVMTPDIETYAPCIEAVFDTREPRIPYSIADRCALSANTMAGGLLALLDIVESRFKAGDVLALLDNPAIGENFNISSEDRELIEYWVERTRTKWGIDEEHRRSFDLPTFSQNTWRQGLDRLLAGVVFDGRRPDIYTGILPYGDIESEQTAVLGQFLTFWEKLVGLKHILCTPHPLDEWCAILKDMLSGLFSPSDEYRNERYLLQQVIDGLVGEQADSGCRMSMELSVVRGYLADAILSAGAGAGFLNGGVSFCAMLPMRSIPFSVICLMGLNADVYPRRDVKTGFNVMERERRPGDRSLRYDDQYLFLESVLSARKYLLISYVGLSQTDNSALLPSVLVSDFLDYLDRNYSFEANRSVSEDTIRYHRLHAFSPAYFTQGDRLYSYSRSNYLSARAIGEGLNEKKPFFSQPIECSGLPEKNIALRDLICFYADPVRFFLENRLGMNLPGQLWKDLQDSEPFQVDPLSAYRIKSDIIENRLQYDNKVNVLERTKAEGVLPVGTAGELLFYGIREQTATLADRIARYFQNPAIEKRSVNISIGDESISGVLDQLHVDYRLVYRPAKLKMKDYLSVWITHLVMNAALHDDAPRSSLIFGEDGCWRFEPVTDAANILGTLIDCYRLGRTKPLKLFPRASWAYALAQWQKNKPMEVALEQAQSLWAQDDNDFIRSDSEEIAMRICFENENPIDKEFQITAEAVLKELCLCMKKMGDDA